ncbi:MAG: hypothetical protein CSA52_01535 [Gammaproteobacteria bacterium]|nr:MAG: hypothetical protein CSB48_09425 [Pseudomonadota bacterium]PIE38653.1 MAG: hypothetical protein CSA52_01535 [Gammaproteobacteria bacterium]
MKTGKKVTAVLLSVAGTQGTILPVQALAASTENVNLQHMKYTESDSRIDVNYTLLSISKDFGTDFSWSGSASLDAITGATPVVDAKTGASQYSGGDGYLLNDGLATADGYKTHLVEMEDERTAFNTSLTWRTENRHEWTVGISHSEEEDYDSYGFSVEHLHNLHRSRNRTLSIGYSRLNNDALFYRDNSWRGASYNTLEIGLTEILSAESLVKVSVFAMYESGELSNPYKRIVRKVNAADAGVDPVFRYYLSPDRRPDERKIVGADIKGVKRIHISEYPVTLHAQYRNYFDSWGTGSHTLEGKAYFGETEQGFGQFFASLRYMTQTAASFYRDADEVFDVNGYGSSDERLGDFNDTTLSAGWERKVIQDWSVSFRASKQTQSTDLDMTWAWLGVNYEL